MYDLKWYEHESCIALVEYLCWPAWTVEGIWYPLPSERSRLSERIRNPSQVLRERPSRSGEEVSPERENATTPLFHFSSSHLGERSSPERENPLAWARPFNLSENCGRMCRVLFSSLFLDACHLFGWIYYVKAWNEWFCM